MPIFQHGDVELSYEVTGNPDGDVVFLIAPGGMRSAAAAWERTPWNPRTRLAEEFRLIAMDQRNAGSSRAPVSANDGWHTYAADQLALLDHLCVDRCHLLGMCIGGPYIFGLLAAAPARFRSAVLLQPVGIHGNREAFYAMFDAWAAELAPAHPEASEADWAAFRANMWDGEFVLTMTPDQVGDLDTPLLLMMGNDLYHPESTSRTIANIAPHVTFVEQWKQAEHQARTDATIREFLLRHSSDVS